MERPATIKYAVQAVSEMVQCMKCKTWVHSHCAKVRLAEKRSYFSDS